MYDASLLGALAHSTAPAGVERKAPEKARRAFADGSEKLTSACLLIAQLSQCPPPPYRSFTATPGTTGGLRGSTPDLPLAGTDASATKCVPELSCSPCQVSVHTHPPSSFLRSSQSGKHKELRSIDCAARSSSHWHVLAHGWRQLRTTSTHSCSLAAAKTILQAPPVPPMCRERAHSIGRFLCEWATFGGRKLG
jgi:hypothetical protein